MLILFETTAKLLQLCLTLCDPIDGSPPGSPVPGILQARTLEWVAISFSNAGKWKLKVKSLSRVRLFTTPWTAAYQAPLPMGFSRQEYWSGVPSPSPKEPKSHDWKQRCSIKNGLGSLRAGHLWGTFHFSSYFQVAASHPPHIYCGSVLLSSLFHLLSLSLSLSFSLKNQWAAVFQLHRVSAFPGKLRQRPRRNELIPHRGIP